MFWQGRSEIGNKQYFFLGLTKTFMIKIQIEKKIGRPWCH